MPGISQVFTAAPDGTGRTPLGRLGYVTNLRWSHSMPGGPKDLSCLLQRDPRSPHAALEPGRTVTVMRGGSKQWDGKLDQPVPGPDGWSLTAHGTGTLGAEFAAEYTGAWPSAGPDTMINRAITRGLRWENSAGVNGTTGLWMGQPSDPASTTIADLLDVCCTKGGLSWMVDCGPGANTLRLFALPTTVTRFLTATSPVGPDLGDDINRVWVRYQSTPDVGGGIKAAYATTSSVNQASIDRHGVMETYTDLSSAGAMTQSDAQAVGTKVLTRYQRAGFAGPIPILHGQLTNTGGAPVDLGCERAGTVVRLVLADGGYGGQLSGTQVTFITGEYEWDDDSQSAAVTPFTSLRHDFAGLLAMRSSQAQGRPWRAIYSRWRHHRHHVTGWEWR